MLDFSFLKNKPGNIIFRNSGGPDCAILMYMTALYIKENNLDIKFYHVTVDSKEKFFYIKYAKKLIQFIYDEFGIECLEHRTDVLEHTLDENGNLIGYAEAQRKLSTELHLEHPDIRYEFVGSSNMLPGEITIPALRRATGLKWDSYKIDSTRTTETIKPTIRNIVRSGQEIMLYTPLANMNKYDVSLLYIEHDLMNTLFPITRSCEAASTDSYRYLGEKHCGQCLFCIERQIAFGRLV